MKKVLSHLVNWFGAVIVAMIIMNVLLALHTDCVSTYH